MANGLLGKTVTTANTDVVVYTVGSALQYAVASITLVNQDTVNAKIKIAIGSGASPAPSDYIEYGAELAANGGGLERTCITLSPGEKVWVNADSSAVAVRVYGLEQV